MKSIAPGKIIFAGEYVGIFGESIVLTAVNLNTSTKVVVSDEKNISVRSDRFANEVLTVRTPELLEMWNRGNEDLERYFEYGDAKQLAKYREGNLTPMMLAVGGALSDCQASAGLEVMTETELPIGAGLGSSASMVASVIGGVWSKLGRKFSLKELNERTYRVEQILNGRPSGGDNSGVIYGGWLKFQRINEELITENLNGEVLKDNWWLVNGGKPEENSLEMIARVVEMKKSNRKLLDRLIERERVTIAETIRQVKNRQIEPALVDESQLVLEEMGVVGERGIRIIKEIKQIGGHAKISGAGGLKNGVGTILVYCEDKEALDNLSKKMQLEYQGIKLGGEGWRIEK